MDMTDLRALPKIDLHRHLEGAVRLQTIIDHARVTGVTLPADPDEAAKQALVTEPVASLEVALNAFTLHQGAFISLDAVRRIAREAVEDLHRDNVRLAELRFSPAFMCQPADLDWDEALEQIVVGIEQALAAGADVTVGLIVIHSRDLGPEAGEESVRFALRHRGHIVGFDIAGPEQGFPPEDYVDLVKPIRDAGMHLTTHYGESGPPEYPKAAVELLGAERLGHGVAVAHDRAVTDLVIERSIALEMCPTSNWLTHAVDRVEDHPSLRLLRAGAEVSINTDDPGLFGIDLTHEYEAARDRIGFTDDDLRAQARNAIATSFLPDDVKVDVGARHFGWAFEGA
jgi:adenosine deaminase